MTGAYSKLEARIARHGKSVKTFQKLLLPWFAKEGRVFPWRDPNASSYVRVISELLLQRTRADAVAAFFPQFISRFPGWAQLSAATDSELRVFLQPIGLWKRRAVTLQALAREMEMLGGRFPSTRYEIETLPGIGQYIASAVLLFCHGAREPLLDVNMSRVLERCFGQRQLVDIRYDPWLQVLSRRIVDHPRATQLNWAILDLASRTCTIRLPQCTFCPVVSCCRYASDRKLTRPIKRERRPPGDQEELARDNPGM